jgi:branched-chain amino acid transport system substrate-binding protein
VQSVREAELRSRRILACTSLSTLLLAAGCSSSTGGGTAADTTDIVIGASLEVTGPGSEVGQIYEHALRLKVDQLNAGKTLNGRKVRLDVKDNKGDPASATSQMSDFAANGSITAAIMGVSSTIADGAGKVANTKKLPAISLAPVADVSKTTTDAQFLFKLAPNVDQDSSVILSTIPGYPGSLTNKSIGVVHSADDYGQKALDAFTAQVPTTGNIKLLKAELPADETGYVTAVKPVAPSTKAPEAVVVFASPNQASAAADALREAQYKGPIFLDAAAAGDVFYGMKTTTENVSLLFTQTMAIDDVIATNPATAARKQWFQDYTAKYGSYNGQASLAADAVQLIVNSVLRAGTATDRDKIRTSMEQISFDGLSGPIRMAPNSHTGLMPQGLAILAAQNGRWRLIA